VNENKLIEDSTESSGRTKRPLPNLLVQGFRIAWLHWPFVIWAYALNLGFGLLAGIPVAEGLSPFLDHSLAAQKIAGTINLSQLAELGLHLRATSLFEIATRTSAWLNLLQVLLLFVLFAGTVFAYVAAEPPQLSVLMRGGVAYFWRFVRAAALAGSASVIILGILFAARSALLTRADAVYVERRMFVYSAVSGIVLLFVGLLLRLWWDLVEVYIVRNVMDGERHVRHALLPALKLLFQYFFRTFGSFLLAGLAGLAGLALCLFVWKELIPAHQVWLAFLLAQVGLFLLLASRFWQRGIEAALVIAAAPPAVAEEEIEEENEALELDEVIEPAATGLEPVAEASGPELTLRDLVLKLQTAPLASPPTALPPDPDKTPQKTQELKVAEPVSTLIDKHTTKFPLGGVEPEKLPDKAVEKPKLIEKPEEKPKPAEEPKKGEGKGNLPEAGKKP
jgi:hypothetical protein